MTTERDTGERELTPLMRVMPKAPPQEKVPEETPEKPPVAPQEPAPPAVPEAVPEEKAPETPSVEKVAVPLVAAPTAPVPEAAEPAAPRPKPRLRLPRISLPAVHLPQIPLRTRLTLAGALSVLSVAAAGALFYEELAQPVREVATKLREMPSRAPVPPEPAPESSATPVPVYAAFKLVGQDQELVVVDSGGQYRTVVPSVQVAIPELSTAHTLEPLSHSAAAPFFAAVPPEGGEVTAFYAFDPAEESFSRLTALEAHHLTGGATPISPDGYAALSAYHVDAPSGQTLYLIDLAGSVATAIDALDAGETFLIETASSTATPKLDAHWIDDATISVGVYAAGTASPQLLRREELGIARGSTLSPGEHRYELRSSARSAATQSLLGFDEQGAAEVLIPNVQEMFPELEGTLMEIATPRTSPEGMLSLRVATCQGSCQSRQGDRYTFNLATKTLSPDESTLNSSLDSP